jgi:GNAT superfamily N-acetyltransferase
MALEVTPARGLADLRAFVALPFRLHKGTPWIPPLKLERYAYLSKPTNPFYKNGEAQLFLARRDGKVVGRISAQVSNPLNAHNDNRWGLFGFFDFEDDQAVVDALLAAAEAWLRERGRDVMVGPTDFIPNEELGVLIEGYEIEPMIREPWHPPYYRERIEAAGLSKAIDVFHWRVDVGDREDRMLPVLNTLAETSRVTHGIKIRRMSRKRLRKDLDEFVKVYNAAWSRNWGFVPFEDADMGDLWFNYQLIFSSDWFMIAEEGDKTVAMAITIPDVHQVYKKMKGRLLPFGWFHYLNRKRIIDRVRIGFLGVLPEYQHTGVAAALYLEHFDTAARVGVGFGEAGWILETNRSMNRGLEAMGARITKVCRVYERPLENGASAAPPETVRRYDPPDSARAAAGA